MDYVTKGDLKEQAKFYYWLKHTVRSQKLNDHVGIFKGMLKIKERICQ